MIKFINKTTGSIMFVDESRKEEYLKGGHTIVLPEEKKEVPKKKTARTTRKKV